MTQAQQEKQIEAIVERKLLEFLGDPDEGLKLRPSFVAKLRKSIKDKRKADPDFGLELSDATKRRLRALKSKKQKYISHEEVKRRFARA